MHHRIIIILYVSSVFIGLSILFTYKAYAAVTVTAATGGTNISGDRAENAASPSWVTLGQIRIAEGANGDIPANTTNGTIILTAPTGWNFNTATGIITYTAGRDITTGAIIMGTNTITIRITTDATANARDRININNIQVRSLSGHIISQAGNILRLSSNPGTATVAGITNNTTNFGSLSQITGSVRNFDIILTGQTRGGALVGPTGTPKYVFPNLQFQLVGIWAVDQFDNIVTTYAGTRTLTYSGPSTSSGSNVYTTSVSFTAGKSTTTLNTTLRTPGVFRIQAASGTVLVGTSSQFTVMNGAVMIDNPTSLPLPDIGASSSQQIVQETTGLFTVEDQKAIASGYYTTLQCSNLSDGVNSIANTNISLSGSTLTLLSGDANASVTTSLGATMQTCNSAIAFIRRNSGASGAGKYSEYGASITARVTIPARQPVGDYVSTLTYTLIEN